MEITSITPIRTSSMEDIALICEVPQKIVRKFVSTLRESGELHEMYDLPKYTEASRQFLDGACK